MRPLLLLLLAACGTPAATTGPVIDGATVQPIDAVTLKHTPVTVDREITVTGSGFMGTAYGPWVRFGEVESPSVRLRDGNTIIALVPESVHGMQTVTVINPDALKAEVKIDLR